MPPGIDALRDNHIRAAGSSLAGRCHGADLDHYFRVPRVVRGRLQRLNNARNSVRDLRRRREEPDGCGMVPLQDGHHGIAEVLRGGCVQDEAHANGQDGAVIIVRSRGAEELARLGELSVEFLQDWRSRSEVSTALDESCSVLVI